MEQIDGKIFSRAQRSVFGSTLEESGFLPCVRNKSLFVRLSSGQVQAVELTKFGGTSQYVIDVGFKYCDIPTFYSFLLPPPPSPSHADLPLLGRLSSVLPSEPPGWYEYGPTPEEAAQRLQGIAAKCVTVLDGVAGGEWKDPSSLLDALPPQLFHRSLAQGDGDRILRQALGGWFYSVLPLAFALCKVSQSLSLFALANEYADICLHFASCLPRKRDVGRFTAVLLAAVEVGAIPHWEFEDFCPKLCG